MKTVYDLLGIRSDASAEAVKKAFHAAVKLHHPDCRPGDRDAASLRFRQIVAAYAILRDAKRRAAYDRRLAFERQRIRSERTRAIISGAVFGSVGMTLAIGFLSIGPTFSTSIVTEKVKMDTARGPTEMAALQSPARNDATSRDGLRATPEIIPERAIEPSAAGPATNATGVQAIVKHEPARRPLPNALGLQPDDAEFHLESRRNMPSGRLGRVQGHL
jgi:curved DNA-binding protein CbpA